MKKLLTIVMLSFSLQFLAHSQDYLNKGIVKKFILTKDTISARFERFDTNFFNKMCKHHNMDSIRIWGLVFHEPNGGYSTIGYAWPSSYAYWEYNSKGNKKRCITESDSEFIDKIYLTNLFEVTKTYFKNGGIKSKSVWCDMGFFVNKRYCYGLKGNITAVVDTDSGYLFGYKKLFAFCKERQIAINNFPVGLPKTTIRKNIYEGFPVWIIRAQFSAEQPYQQNNFFIIDGKNGNILKESFLPPIRKHN